MIDTLEKLHNKLKTNDIIVGFWEPLEITH